jgi:integrase
VRCRPRPTTCSHSNSLVKARRPISFKLRHTFATLHLEGGASPVWVKEQLGHSSIQVTVDFYKHWIPRTNRDGINRLDMQQTRIFNEEADEIGN